MTKRHNWEEVGEIVAKIKELGLSYKEGSHQFGIKPWVVYEYNRRQRSEKEDSAAVGSVASNSGKRGSCLPEEVRRLIAEYRQEHP